MKNLIHKNLGLAALIGLSVILAEGRALAADPAPGGGWGDLQRFGHDWIERSDRIKSEQPHWITPVVTVTPRLEQEFRFDERWQQQPGGIGENVSPGMRLELIPFQNVELILGSPPYIARSRYKRANGKPYTHGFDDWGDVAFLVKYRLFAANEETGNYIVTAFLGISAPTGPKRTNPGHVIYTPTIAFGKGWGDFDFQSTVAVALPDGGMSRLGMPVAYNTAFQYRILKKIWPELEFNYGWWPNGDRKGESQLYLTPGIVIGRLPLWGPVGFTIGTGVQVALTEHRAFNRNWLLSVRFPF
jgi:hypothetical protein